MGAGVAVLISLDLLIGEKSIILPDSTQIRCFAFAPPPVFRSASDGSSISDNVMNKINIIINNHDCIPRTSLGEILIVLMYIFLISSQRKHFSRYRYLFLILTFRVSEHHWEQWINWKFVSFIIHFTRKIKLLADVILIVDYLWTLTFRFEAHKAKDRISFHCKFEFEGLYIRLDI